MKVIVMVGYNEEGMRLYLRPSSRGERGKNMFFEGNGMFKKHTTLFNSLRTFANFQKPFWNRSQRGKFPKYEIYTHVDLYDEFMEQFPLMRKSDVIFTSDGEWFY